MIYNFSLTFPVSRKDWNINDISNKLYESGCDDSTVFTGIRSLVCVEFHRESASAKDAIHSATDDIMRAFPDTHILEARPDLVNMADIAELVGQSRQNIRKLVDFPPPSANTATKPLWHLYLIVKWYMEKTGIQFDNTLAELSREAWMYNQSLETNRMLNTLGHHPDQAGAFSRSG
ncbi:MAG: DNA-binding protein [Magnetococcales bacterium]|nr:DNA-binding protein [Magnetococcales bacterium]